MVTSGDANAQALGSYARPNTWQRTALKGLGYLGSLGAWIGIAILSFGTGAVGKAGGAFNWWKGASLTSQTLVGAAVAAPTANVVSDTVVTLIGPPEASQTVTPVRKSQVAPAPLLPPSNSPEPVAPVLPVVAKSSPVPRQQDTQTLAPSKVVSPQAAQGKAGKAKRARSSYATATRQTREQGAFIPIKRKVVQAPSDVVATSSSSDFYADIPGMEVGGGLISQYDRAIPNKRIHRQRAQRLLLRNQQVVSIQDA